MVFPTIYIIFVSESNNNDMNRFKNNKLIGEYMERKLHGYDTWEDLEYHLDWGELMPVIGKIQEAGVQVKTFKNPTTKHCYVEFNSETVIFHNGEDMLTTMYECVCVYLKNK